MSVAGPSFARGFDRRGRPSSSARRSGGRSAGSSAASRAASRRAQGGLRDCCSGFVRVVYPDPDDFLAVAIGDRTLWRLPAHSRHEVSEDAVCIGLISPGGVGTGCRDRDRLFERGPLDLTWGFSGGGQQLWIVSGVASDDVRRIEVFLGNGERWDAPLRDNATAFRLQRAKFPAGIVGYDAAGRVIAVQTIRG